MQAEKLILTFPNRCEALHPEPIEPYHVQPILARNYIPVIDYRFVTNLRLSVNIICSNFATTCSLQSCSPNCINKEYHRFIHSHECYYLQAVLYLEKFMFFCFFSTAQGLTSELYVAEEIDALTGLNCFFYFSQILNKAIMTW